MSLRGRIVPGGVGVNPKDNFLGAVEDPVFLRGTSKVYTFKSGLSRIPDFADRELAFKHYSKHVKGVEIRPVLIQALEHACRACSEQEKCRCSKFLQSVCPC
jgi:hypothetical protein